MLQAIQYFPIVSSGGANGFRPTSEARLLLDVGADLLSAVTASINWLLEGCCHPEIVPVVFRGRLTGLDKTSGGI